MLKKDTIPVAPFKGLFLDGVTIPGGLSKAENITILPDGTAERRLFERTLTDNETCLSSRGTKEVYELLTSGGTRYIFADIDNSETYTSAFGAEQIGAIASWAVPAGGSWGTYSSGWTHVAGNVTPLVATMGTALVATTNYRLVVNVTCPTPTSASTGWAFTRVDSGQTWVSQNGNSQKIWVNTWTHTASGGTTALCSGTDFTVTSGASYVIKVHATQSAGTSLSVYVGDTLAGTITATGLYTYIVRFVTTVSYDTLRFVPTNDWAGTVTKSWPHVPSKVDDWCSVVKLVDPAGDAVPSNYDYTASTHIPSSWYLNGAELLYYTNANWYPEAAANLKQSVAVTLGAKAAGTISASGEYSYDVLSTDTTAVTFTPTTSWTGTITAASVKLMTQAAAATRTKVIGGTVTGTTDYEVVWVNILTDLTSGDTVHPCWATLQDRAIRVDGTNRNYWFSDAVTPHTLGVPAPADAPVTADANTTGGNIVAGTYNVRYTYVKKIGTYIVEGNPSPESNVTVTNNSITVAVVACTSEADVTHIRIYRTLYGEMGAKYYFEQEVANGTATITLLSYDDDIGDGAELEFDHDMPPTLKYILGAGGRLWGVDNAGTLWWSKLYQPELWPSDQFQSFDPKDGDVPMGICALRKHLLYFKRRRTWLVDMFSDSVDEEGVAAISKDVVSSTLGCIASGSIQSSNDSAIWLSHAGFILYDGGTMQNISAGDPTTGIPSRIQNTIINFMGDGAEHFIDSAYHTGRQLYHVNFLTRNGAGTTITAQRHFVYNLSVPGGAWTEYVYRDSSGNKMYETNFAMAHDSLGNEVILIPYISSTTGTITYVYQGEYGEPPTAIYYASEILDSTGVGGVTCSGPVYSFCDSSDNVYIIDQLANVFKITSAGVKSLIKNGNTMADAIAGTDVSPAYVYGVWPDLTNSCLYIWYDWTQSEVIASSAAKLTFTGTATAIFSDSRTLGYCPVGMNSDHTVMYAFGYLTPVRQNLYSITNPGGTNTAALLLATGVTPNVTNAAACCVYDGDLYFTATVGSNTHLCIVSDLSTTPTIATHSVGVAATACVPQNLIVVSSSKVVFTYRDASGNAYVMEGNLSGSTWTFTTVVDSYTPQTASAYDQLEIQVKTNGDYILGSVGNYVYNYTSDWKLIKETYISGITAAVGVSHLIGTSEDENTLIICGHTTNNAYKLWPNTVTLGDTEPTLKNAVVHIVSNYNDLGISNDKRISRAYLDVDCKYPGCGSFSIEPDFGVNYHTHAVGESSEPSGSVSLRPWYHPGHQTYVYTNSTFDSDVEQWEEIRLDVGAKGRAFRYCIRAGDVSTNVTGTMRIKPPKIEVQIKSKT